MKAWLWIQIFTEGISNKLIGYFLEEDPRDVIIFKIYGPGTEDMIDRGAEIDTMLVCLQNYTTLYYQTHSFGVQGPTDSNFNWLILPVFECERNGFENLWAF